MTASLKTIEGQDISHVMGEIGRRARAAARVLALAPTDQKNRALTAMAQAIRTGEAAILAANAGGFARGDAVIIRGPDGAEVGRGLVAYDAADAEQIRGKSSGDILVILGLEGRAEMVHRDDLVLARD